MTRSVNMIVATSGFFSVMPGAAAVEVRPPTSPPIGAAAPTEEERNKVKRFSPLSSTPLGILLVKNYEKKLDKAPNPKGFWIQYKDTYRYLWALRQMSAKEDDYIATEDPAEIKERQEIFDQAESFYITKAFDALKKELKDVDYSVVTATTTQIVEIVKKWPPSISDKIQSRMQPFLQRKMKEAEKNEKAQTKTTNGLLSKARYGVNRSRRSEPKKSEISASDIDSNVNELAQSFWIALAEQKDHSTESYETALENLTAHIQKKVSSLHRAYQPQEIQAYEQLLSIFGQYVTEKKAQKKQIRGWSKKPVPAPAFGNKLLKRSRYGKNASGTKS